MSVKLIAYYLPQFHPIPENDKWWGKGFTEWTNVTKAKPLFEGHYQPRFPADLGYYDLRLPEARIAQADLAQKYGIDGFCYWHYWFKGRRLLERPFNDMFNSNVPDYPFCIGWANESWTRTWEGDEKEILIKQEYSHEDDIIHARWLANVFSDHRYLTFNSRPILVIYRAPALPDAKRTIETIKAECTKMGLKEPYVIGRDTHYFGVDMRDYGCDITESTPNFGMLYQIKQQNQPRLNTLIKRIFGANPPNVFDYTEACELMDKNRPDFLNIPTVLAGWDNTARREERALILNNANPDSFRKILSSNISKVLNAVNQPGIVFINAWNEWAEGMYLEPDQKWGHGFLEAVLAAKKIKHD
jgi:lipopolysaccharide biosynthesis protein